MDWSFVEKIMRSKVVRTAYVYGPPGIGKTYCAYTVLRARQCKDVYAITLTEETPAAELRGHFILQGGEFVWSDGPFTAAMRAGARLVINELSHASDDVRHILYPVLESASTARITLPTKETLKPRAGFHVICTDNVPPSALPEALQDRFDAVVHIQEPHPRAIESLPERFRPAKVTVGLEQDRRVSFRQWHAIARMEDDGFDLSEACRATLGERAAEVADILALGGEA